MYLVQFSVREIQIETILSLLRQNENESVESVNRMYVKWAIGGYHKEAIYSPITSKRLEAINHRCLVAKQGGGKKSLSMEGWCTM